MWSRALVCILAPVGYRQTAPMSVLVFCGLRGLTLKPLPCTMMANDVMLEWFRHRLWDASERRQVVMSGLRCDKCGSSDRISGIENVPEDMRPFVRGEVVITMNPLGICGECYAVLCGKCADHGKCSVCGAPYPLLGACPSTAPDDPAKRAKWRKVRDMQLGGIGRPDDSEKKWWQFWK